MTKDTINRLSTINSSSNNMVVNVSDSNFTKKLSLPTSTESHNDNLKCSICEIKINYNFYQFQEMFYCQDHYKNVSGNYCIVCKDMDVKGPIIKINNVDVHTECFECSICHNYIDPNDAYTLYNNCTMICCSCMNKSNILSMHLPLVGNNDAHQQYFIKYYPKDLYDQNNPEFEINLKSITFSSRKLTTKLDDNFRKLALSEDPKLDPLLYCSSPFQGLKVKKFKPLNLIAKQQPPIFEKDILIMVNDIPCIVENSLKIIELLTKKFSTVKVIYLLRLFHDKSIITCGEATTLHTHTHTDDHFPSSTGSDSYLSPSPIRHNKTNSNSLIDLKCTSKNLNLMDSTRLRTASQLPSSNLRRMNKYDFIHNKSDDLHYNNNYSSHIGGKRFSCSHKNDLKYDFVPNNLERSQSQTLHHNHGQVFTENDLIFMESLGEGFFGKALKVVNKRTNEAYAMKILKVVNNLTMNSFRKEVQMMKSVNHPNLVKFIGVFLTQEGINVMMDFINGGTLKKYIEAIRNKIKPMFTPQQMYSMVMGMSSGMAYLHSKNIVHRDLTSSNCLLQDDQNLKVVISDFGLSEVITQKHTKLGVVGSPYWMAPEMLNGKIYDIRVDIFSFGIIICEMTTLLDASPDFLKRNKDFSLDTRSYLHELQPKVPYKFSTLAIKCCDMDPKKRPQFSIIYNTISLEYDILEKKFKK